MDGNAAPRLLPDSVTSLQVDTLLRVTAQYSALVFFGGERTEEPNGNCLTSAQATFINACNALDNLLTDPSRWSLGHMNRADERLEQAHALNMQFLRNQAEASKEIGTPHFRYRPALMKMESGKWMAFLGDLERDPGSCIIGIGAFPEQAVSAFDEMFSGKIPDHMVEWLNQREQALDQNLPSPPPPQKPNDTKPPLDDRTTNEPESPSGGG